MIWTAATTLAGSLVDTDHGRRRNPGLSTLIAEHGLVRGVAHGVKWRVPSTGSASGDPHPGQPGASPRGGAGRRTP